MFEDGWRQEFKRWSTRVVALSAAMVATWPIVPADIKAMLPDWTEPVIAGVMLFAYLLARNTKQKRGPDGRLT
ncbi:hypothetical protein V6767_20020 [Martelella sp. FLE1502]